MSNQLMKGGGEEGGGHRVRRQNAVIDRIRHENEILRQDLARESKDSRFVSVTTATESEIKKLQDQAETYIKKTDIEKQRIEELDRRITDVQSRILDQRQKVGGPNASKENNEMVTKQIRILENRLDKALVKFNESLARNKQLREQIDSLRRERVVFDGIYKKLERDLHEKKKEMAAIIEQSHAAYQAREKSATEMAALKAQAEKDRQLFEQEWRELGRLIEQDKKIKESIRFQRKKQRMKDTGGEIGAGIKPETEGLDGGSGGVEMFGSSAVMGASSINSLSTERVLSYEQAFARIQEATGITDIDEIVDRFLEAEDKNFSLFNFVNDLNAEVERLESLIADTKAEIDRCKGQGASSGSQRKKILQALAEQLQRTQAKAEDYEQRYRSAMKTIGQLKQGIQSIFNRIGCATSSVEEMLGNQGVTESNMMQYLGIIEQRTNEILQVYATSQQLSLTSASGLAGASRTSPLNNGSHSSDDGSAQGGAGAGGSGSGGGVGGGGLVPAHRVQVQAPGWDDLSSGDESENENDERPLTREELRSKYREHELKEGGARNFKWRGRN